MADLHDKDGVVGVGRVGADTEAVADVPGRGQLAVVQAAFPATKQLLAGNSFYFFCTKRCRFIVS